MPALVSSREIAEVPVTVGARWRSWLPVIGVWLIALSLVVSLRGLPLGDETKYLETGRRLLRGIVPPVSAFPLTAAAIAAAERLSQSICELPECVPSLFAGRLLVAVCLAVSNLATAAFLRAAGQPLAAWLALLLFPGFPSVILLLGMANASDWTALALIATSAFLTLRACVKPSAPAAGLVAVTVVATWLSRPEGLPLALVCGALLSLLSTNHRLRATAAYSATLVVLLVAVTLFYASRGQTVDWTNQARSYVAFEQGYGHVFPGRIEGSPWFEGREYAARVFGTAQENQHSIFRAALRHPTAFLERVLAALVQGTRELAIVASVSLPVVLSALLGLLVSGPSTRASPVRLPQASRQALVIALAFPLIITPYVLTFYRSGYFLLVIWVPIALLSSCLARVLSHLAAHQPARKRLFVGALIISLAAGSGFATLKVLKWRNEPLSFHEQLAVVRALADTTIPGSTIWAASPHLIRHAHRAAFGIGMAPPRSCKALEGHIEGTWPRYLLVEVGVDQAVVSRLQSPDLRQMPDLARHCGLADIRELFLPSGVAQRRRLFEFRWRRDLPHEDLTPKTSG